MELGLSCGQLGGDGERADVRLRVELQHTNPGLEADQPISAGRHLVEDTGVVPLTVRIQPLRHAPGDSRTERAGEHIVRLRESLRVAEQVRCPRKAGLRVQLLRSIGEHAQERSARGRGVIPGECLLRNEVIRMLNPVAGTLAGRRGQSLQELPQHGHSLPPKHGWERSATAAF